MNENKQNRVWHALTQALHCQYSSFYKDFYQAHMSCIPDARKTEWLTLPRLSKVDLLKVPYEKRVCIPPAAVDTIRYTSGTSGKGILVTPLSAQSEEWLRLRRLPGKNVVTFFHHHHRIQPMFGTAESRARVIAGDPAKLPATALLASHIYADALRGSPSIVLAFAEHLSEEMRNNIMLLSLTSERTTLLQLQALSNAYTRAKIIWGYASAEGAGVSASSPRTPLSKHPFALTPEDDFSIEILSEDGHPVVENEVGEVTLTSLESGCAFPLIRYRTGDRARLIQEDSEKPVFEILGRTEEESVRIPRGEIHLAELERSIQKVTHNNTSDFEATIHNVLSENGALITQLSITLMAPDASTLDMTEKYARAIERELRVNQNKTYGDGVEKGFYAPIACAIVPITLTPGVKRQHLRDKRI